MAILLKDVSKVYASYARGWDRLREALTGRNCHRDFTALQPISVEIKQGEVVGLIGKNGAGKSTFLKLLAGTLAPTTGSLAVSGRISALLELGAGFHPDMTGRENVYLAATVIGVPREHMDTLYPEIVEFSGLSEFMDQPVKTYSSGMFVRLAFSVATSIDPDVLIIDEALSVGDGAFSRKSFDRIMGFKQAGKTILFCSHALYQVEALCDRVLWLDHGKLMMDGEPTAVVMAYSDSMAVDAEGAGKENASVPSSSAPMEGAARISSVRVSSEGRGGTALHLISGRSDLTIEICFESDPSLPTPSVALLFFRQDGMCASSAGSRNDGIPLYRDEKGSGRASVTFTHFPLLRGSYWVDVLLMCEKAIHLYDAARVVATLSVSQQGLEQGVVSLPRRWNSPLKSE
jgi:lipopolysaccharide transport system ATP-binding protein